MPDDNAIGGVVVIEAISVRRAAAAINDVIATVNPTRKWKYGPCSLTQPLQKSLPSICSSLDYRIAHLDDDSRQSQPLHHRLSPLTLVLL